MDCFLGHRKLLVLLILVFLPFGSAGAEAKEEMRVLFIGNSLTYWNDLPAIIQAIAREVDQKNITVESVAYPDYSLEDHWTRGDALRTIRKGKWTYVVLQQGPSASADARELLIRFTEMFAKEIRAIGSQPALFSVWPSKSRKGDFERSIESYSLAARRVDGVVIPVGRAWLDAWSLDPKLALYSPDGLHPGPDGSYLAALVFYKTFFSKSITGVPSRFKLSSKNTPFLNIDAPIARLLQQAATQPSNP